MPITNSLGKGKSVREVFVNFAELCSMQGIPYIHAATFWWSRLIWVFLTFTAIGALIFHLYYIMSQYYEYPVQTKVSMGFNNLQLPAMTICNVNVLRKSQLYEKNSTEMEVLRDVIQALAPKALDDDYSERRKRFVDGNSEINVTVYDGSFYNEDDNEDEMTFSFIMKQLFKYTYMNLTRDVRKDAGHFMSDMIMTCSFAGRDCTAKAFTLHQTADYGNCWELNTTNMVVKMSGEIGGFSITLNLQNWEIIEGVSQGYGARLVVHEPGTIAFPSTEGIFISSSFETNIGLRMVAVSRLGEPYSYCDDGKAFQERYGVTYTKQYCQFICLAYKLLHVCGCYEESEEELAMMVEGSRRCKTYEDLVCLRKVVQDYQDKKIPCDCLNPCNEIGYVKTISSRPWPTDEYADKLGWDRISEDTENNCEHTLEHVLSLPGAYPKKDVIASYSINAIQKKGILYDLCIINNYNEAACSTMKQYTASRSLRYNFLKLNVYFEDLNFEMIDEAPEISLSQLMSDVGGAIGLWIGLSVLALCEIFHLIIELCALGINMCCSNGQTQHSSEGDIEHSKDGNMIDKENRHHEQMGQNRTHFYLFPMYSSNRDQYQQRFGYPSPSPR